MVGRYSSEIRTGCANERTSGSARGAISNGRPYRDLIDPVGSLPLRQLRIGDFRDLSTIPILEQNRLRPAVQLFKPLVSPSFLQGRFGYRSSSFGATGQQSEGQIVRMFPCGMTECGQHSCKFG